MYLTFAHLDFITLTTKSKILRKWDTLGRLSRLPKYNFYQITSFFCRQFNDLTVFLTLVHRPGKGTFSSMRYASCCIRMSQASQSPTRQARQIEFYTCSSHIPYRLSIVPICPRPLLCIINLILLVW